MLRLRRVLPLLACGSLGLACSDDAPVVGSEGQGSSTTGDSMGTGSSSGSGTTGEGTGSGSQGGDHTTGLDTTADGTTTGGPPPECGNGVVEDDEQCDDEGESEACNSDCTFVFCGDGIINATAGEDCDDEGESATCNVDCTTSVCGDKVLNETAGEQCDAGMEAVDCDIDCTPVECGDAVVNATAGEECDDGGESPTCNADCTFIGCGDSIINVAAGEECDDGGESATCNVDCSIAMCGDTVVNMTAGEACDDGGDSVACDADCTPAECGDGYFNMVAEECDDGMQTALCDVDCTPAVCGDGVVNVTAGEQCDDGGASAACDADCTPVTCGDGVSNPVAGEGCDDGNVESNDGCSSSCQPDCDDFPGNNDCASALRLPALGEIDQGDILFANGLVGYAGARDYIEVVFAANDAAHRTGSKLPGTLRIYIDDPLAPGSPADVGNTNVRFRVFEDIIPSGCQSPLNYTVPFTGGLSGPLQNNATNDTALPGPGYATVWEWSDTCDPLELAGGFSNCANTAYTAPHPLPTSFWVEVLPVPGMADACVPYTLVATWQ